MFHVKQKAEIAIRIANPEDAEQIAKIYGYYVKKTAITFEYEAPGTGEIRKRICKTLKTHPYLVEEVNGEIIGYAYTGRYKERKAYDWAAEISVYVEKSHLREGIGGELYEKTEEISRAQNITNLYACITTERGKEPGYKSASAAFHESIGYKLAGKFNFSGNKFGHWYDTIIMEKHIAEHKENPPQVIPFSQLEKGETK